MARGRPFLHITYFSPRLRHFSQAIEDFGSAITVDPTLAEGYHQRAIARYNAAQTQH
jgi:hypothetical protein